MHIFLKKLYGSARKDNIYLFSKALMIITCHFKNNLKVLEIDGKAGEWLIEIPLVLKG
jgi:hypothetical protein